MSKIFSENEILKIGESAFNTKNFELIKYDVGRKSEAALGFLGDHFVLEITAVVNNEKTTKLFFIKAIPESALMGDDFLRETGLFQREVDLYNILFPKFEEVTGSQNWCPKYYYSNNDSLVLEDVSPDGFELAPYKLILDQVHVKITLKALSAFHASSILLEARESKPLDEAYPKLFKEILYDEEVVNSPYKRWVLKGIKDLQAGVNYLPNYSSEQKKLIKEKLPSILWSLYPLNKISEKFKNILIHGDMWRNNLLFKYENGKPVDCKLVDYQFCRYAPPAHDVMCLLYLTTSKKFREEHEQSLLEFYYENLKNGAKNVDLKNLMTWDSFLESCETYRLMALVQAVLSMHYVCGGSDKQIENSLENLSKEEYDKYVEKHRDEYMKTYFQNPGYRDVVVEIFCELVDRYIIKSNQFV